MPVGHFRGQGGIFWKPQAMSAAIQRASPRE